MRIYVKISILVVLLVLMLSLASAAFFIKHAPTKNNYRHSDLIIKTAAPECNYPECLTSDDKGGMLTTDDLKLFATDDLMIEREAPVCNYPDCLTNHLLKGFLRPRYQTANGLISKNLRQSTNGLIVRNAKNDLTHGGMEGPITEGAVIWKNSPRLKKLKRDGELFLNNPELKRDAETWYNTPKLKRDGEMGCIAPKTNNLGNIKVKPENIRKHARKHLRTVDAEPSHGLMHGM